MKTVMHRQMIATALMAATMLGAGIALAEPLGSGLAAYLTFDDAVVSNRIPNSTITGVTLSSSGIESGVRSGEFGHSGFGGYLDINQGWAKLDGSQNLTFENDKEFAICIWMRKDVTPTGDPVFVGNGSWSHSSWPGALLFAQDSYVGLNYSISTTREKFTTSTVTLGEWRFYAITYTSDGKFHFYMSNSSGDLVTIAEKDSPNFKLLYDAVGDRWPFYLGQDGSGAYGSKFEGKLDEFALWTRGLSHTEINAIYQNGRKGHSLDDLLKPEMTVVDAGNGNIDLSFSGARSESYDLYVASGAADGGADRFAWDYFDYVTNVAPTDSSCTFALPEAFKNEGRYYRFFLTKDAAYQEVEYIQNTGSYPSTAAYISTGIRPDRDTTVVTEVEVVGTEGWDNVFGCCDIANAHYFQLGFFKDELRWYEESTKAQPGIGRTVGFGSDIEFGVRYCHDYAVTGVTYWNSSDEGAAGFLSMITDRTRFTDSANALAIFACEKIDGSLYDRCFLGKMYSFVISTNGTVACDYVPAKNTSDVVGLYDVVAKTFHPSVSANPFVGGTEVPGRLTVQSATAKAMTASDPVSAYWIGGTNGAIDDPASWHCENSYGETIEAIPSSLTDITISNVEQVFDVPANSGFICKSIAVAASLTFAGDCDWRGVDFSKITLTGTVDLAGHKLYLSVSEAIGNAVTITDLTGGGELHVAVPAGKTVENTGMALAGAVTLVKDGDGTLTANCPSQSNTGGVYVNAGTLKTTAYINTGILGASGSPVVVGTCGTLRVENGYTGLENHALELAGGILHMYNSRALPGRSIVGSLTVTADSTMRIESSRGVGGDSTCDTELAESTVWDLGGHELTIRFETTDSDFWIGQDKTVKPVFRNGTIFLPSQVGYWQDLGSDAHDNVCYRYEMFNVRQRADSSTSNFINNVSSSANFANEGTMSIYGTYTPISDVGSKFRMMNGSTIDLSGRNGAWPMLGGSRPMTFESGATVCLDFGSRKLTQNEKVVSWSAIPSGVTFASKKKGMSLLVAADGIYVSYGTVIKIR